MESLVKSRGSPSKANFWFFIDTETIVDGVTGRFANKNALKLIQQFAEQMWHNGGIRLAILSGWKNQEREIFSQKYIGAVFDSVNGLLGMTSVHNLQMGHLSS